MPGTGSDTRSLLAPALGSQSCLDLCRYERETHGICGRPVSGRAEGRMKVKTIIIAALLAMALVFAGTASADPLNANATRITGSCTGLGDVEAVAITLSVEASPNSRLTVAHHIVGSTAIVISPDTPGLLRLALAAGTTCTVEAFDGVPLPTPETGPVIIIGA
jgi:hypothetical protein